MPKKVPEQELDAIVAIAAAHPGGVQAVTIQEELATRLPPSMLQRRLALLVEHGRLIPEGRGRGRRYQLPAGTGQVNIALPALEVEGKGETYVPISPEGKAVRDFVRLPVQERRPVGYNREFLDSYRPNETGYLTASIRRHLHETGRAADGQRPAGTHARQIFNRLLIDLTWNSSRLEGNTYSLLETERLLQLGESAEGKDAPETQMILNHKAAIELLVYQADEIRFNRYTILNLHALLSENLLADPGACGRLRRIGVGIEGTVFEPLAVPQLIEETFDQILNITGSIQDPYEQAFFVMVHLPYLQPFEDVNKRVSRLAANIPLIRENLSPLSFVDVPMRAYVDGILGIYELNRIELLRDVFVWAYERSSARYSAVRRSLGEPDPFRLRYRSKIADVVAAIVRDRMNKKAANVYIKEFARNEISQEDRQRFMEVAETEVLNLHEGNIARYRLRPSEYAAWRQDWK